MSSATILHSLFSEKNKRSIAKLRLLNFLPSMLSGNKFIR